MNIEPRYGYLPTFISSLVFNQIITEFFMRNRRTPRIVLSGINQNDDGNEKIIIIIKSMNRLISTTKH